MKSGTLKIPGLHLVPFEDRPADVVAADEHVGPGKAADRPAVDRGAGDVGAGVGAQVARIAHRLGLLAEIDPHLARPDHRPVVLRIDGDHVHRDQGLHGTAARDPGDLLPRLLRGLRLDVVGGHDLLHLGLTALIFRFSFASSFSAIVVSPIHTVQIISTNASNRVLSCPSAGSRSSTSTSMLGNPLPLQGLLEIGVIEGVGIAELEEEEDHPLRPLFPDQTDEVVRPLRSAPGASPGRRPAPGIAPAIAATGSAFSSMRPLN